MQSPINLELEPIDNKRLANLCGALDQHLRQIEQRLGVEINNRGNLFHVFGPERPAKAAEQIIQRLYEETKTQPLTPEGVHLFLQESCVEAVLEEDVKEIVVKVRRGVIRGRGLNQSKYLSKIQKHDINFGIGPAGTGKTYLAVACAVAAFESERVRRMVLVRPAVEAGEKLGFLPGDMREKIDPYLRPLYDSLYDLLDYDKIQRKIESGAIEIAPLAFMRGRTLKNSFAILDEAQNATETQIKMFLTRIGQNSKLVVNGDPSQIDLPNKNQSGLIKSEKILKNIEGISIINFDHQDVMRHPLVTKIVEAYQKNNNDKG